MQDFLTEVKIDLRDPLTGRATTLSFDVTLTDPDEGDHTVVFARAEDAESGKAVPVGKSLIPAIEWRFRAEAIDDALSIYDWLYRPLQEHEG